MIPRRKVENAASCQVDISKKFRLEQRRDKLTRSDDCESEKDES